MLGVCRIWALLREICIFFRAAWELPTNFLIFVYFPVEDMPNGSAIPDMPQKFFSSYSMPSKLATWPNFIRFWPFLTFFDVFWPKFDLIWLKFPNNRWSSWNPVKLHREQSFSTRYWHFWPLKIEKMGNNDVLGTLSEPILTPFFIVKWWFVGMGGQIRVDYSMFILVKTFLTFLLGNR